MDDILVPRLGRLRTREWTRVGHGLYAPTHGAAPMAHVQLDAWALVLPASGAFTHLTAARQLGWWLPPLPPDLPVFAAVPHAEPRPRRAGLLVRRPANPFPVVHHDGHPLTDPAETLLSCAVDLNLLDMTVLVDCCLRTGSCTPPELEAHAERRRRGAPMLRRALRHADARSESPWETLLRMLHVVCDVPVEPQRVVLDRDGRFVARADLWIVGTRTLHEYDGAVHREKGRQRQDLARDRRIGDAGWTRRGYTDVEVLHQAVGILRDADRSLGRPHRPERIRKWHVLLSGSMFTPTGMARVRRRWGLS